MALDVDVCGYREPLDPGGPTIHGGKTHDRGLRGASYTRGRLDVQGVSRDGGVRVLARNIRAWEIWRVSGAFSTITSTDHPVITCSRTAMDETSRTIIDAITVHYDVPTRVPGGHLCTVYYDTSRLTGSELARLAAVAAGHLQAHDFDVAVGLGYSGAFFAGAVAGGKQMALIQENGEIYGATIKGRHVVLVDDVVATGAHLLDGMEHLTRLGAEVIGCVVMIDRRTTPGMINGKPLWSAFQAPFETTSR
jgi:hypothetical protein